MTKGEIAHYEQFLVLSQCFKSCLLQRCRKESVWGERVNCGINGTITGYGDVCRCFTCDGGLQRWDPQDDPWIEHTRWFPECDHVRQTRGQEYIDLVQRAANQSDEDDVCPF